MSNMDSQVTLIRKNKTNGLIYTISKHRFAYFLITPTILYILIFQLYPLMESVRISFTDLSMLEPSSGSYIGIKNYLKLFFEDSQFWSIFRNSFVWVFGSIILQFSLSIPASLVLNSQIKGRAIWRGLMMIPWVTPVIVMGIIWKWIFDGQYGLLNYYLQQLHLINNNIVWLGDKNWVWPALLITSMWKGFPYTTLMFLAGLQGIGKEIYEAANVDGANSFKGFIYITLPLLKPIMFVTGLVSIIASWTKFELIWAFTGGGPGYATSVLPTYVYTQSFKFFELGTGAAVANISAVFVCIILIFYLRLFKSEY